MEFAPAECQIHHHHLVTAPFECRHDSSYRPEAGWEAEADQNAGRRDQKL